MISRSIYIGAISSGCGPLLLPVCTVWICRGKKGGQMRVDAVCDLRDPP